MSLGMLGGALVAEGDTSKWTLIAGGFLVFIFGQRALIALVVRSRVALPPGSPTARLLAETVERFGFTPKGVVLVPSTVANAFALPNGTIMVTTALRVLASDEEIAAITAHKLSHARDGDGRRIQRRRLLGLFLLAGASGGLAGTLALRPGSGLFIVPACVCGGLLLVQLLAFVMARTTQPMEFKCDADAARAGYGPDLASGLAKVHRGTWGCPTAGPGWTAAF